MYYEGTLGMHYVQVDQSIVIIYCISISSTLLHVSFYTTKVHVFIWCLYY